jgi:hypothetical protein
MTIMLCAHCAEDEQLDFALRLLGLHPRRGSNQDCAIRNTPLTAMLNSRSMATAAIPHGKRDPGTHPALALIILDRARDAHHSFPAINARLRPAYVGDVSIGEFELSTARLM